MRKGKEGGESSTYWSLEREEEEERTSKKRIFTWELSLERREKIARSQAIATKAVQVCTPLLLEFLPIFDFSVCLIPKNLIVLLIFGVDEKGHNLLC